MGGIWPNQEEQRRRQVMELLGGLADAAEKLEIAQLMASTVNVERISKIPDDELLEFFKKLREDVKGDITKIL